MSKYTYYQWLIVFIFITVLVLNNIFREQVIEMFSFVGSFIEPSMVAIFFIVVTFIWGNALMLLLEERKGRPLFTHKIWRIMPVLIGLLFLLSFVFFIALFLTTLSGLGPELHWVMDLIVVYFLVIYYFLSLSIQVRYGKAKSSKVKILRSANVATIFLLVVVFLLPSI